MKYMNKTLMLMAAALMAFSACDKWTETEPVNVIYETMHCRCKIRNYYAAIYIEILPPISGATTERVVGQVFVYINAAACVNLIN